MIRNQSLTICPGCGHLVRVCAGLCEVCGEHFRDVTITQHVAEGLTPKEALELALAA
jgi:hypothetical protein